jgi:hypothetical protein
MRGGSAIGVRAKVNGQPRRGQICGVQARERQEKIKTGRRNRSRKEERYRTLYARTRVGGSQPFASPLASRSWWSTGAISREGQR